MRIHFDVSWERPQRHLFDVVMTVRGLPAVGPIGDWDPDDPDPRRTGARVPLRIQMPAWIPGVYEIIDSAMLVQELHAEAGGRPAIVTQIDKQTWSVERGRAATVVIRWRSYANTLSCAASHVDETHAHITGGSFFPYVVGGKRAPHTVTIAVPRGARVATGLDPHVKRNTWGAIDYDTFIDAPIEVGKFRQETFTVAGVPHHIVVHEYGHEEQNLPRLVDDTKRFVRFFRRMFGGFPFDEYWFMLHAHPTLCRGGALEHLNSTHLTLTSYLDDPDPLRYDWLLSVMSHEYFHAWNVKRMRPLGLGPFDYTKETHTPGLWIAEGLTEYYCLYSLRQAGAWTRQQFLDWLAYFVDRYHDMPGRRVMTLRESSFNTWTKATWSPRREHAGNALNAFVDYYTKGALVGWLIDLMIRAETNGRHTLDEVMVAMFRAHGDAELGFDEEAFERTAAEVTGVSLRTFLRSALDGTGKLPFKRVCKTIGLELTYGAATPKEEKRTFRRKILGTLGLEVAVDGRVKVRNVEPDSAAEEAGLDRGDELIAVDGERLGTDNWRRLLGEGEPGTTKAVALFRHGRLQTRPVTLRADGRRKTRIALAKGLTGARKRWLEGWLGPESKERAVPSARP